MEFFTHNAGVNDVSNNVLRGLPSETTVAAIEQAFSDLHIPISHIRKMWRTNVSPDGNRSKVLLPL